MSDIANAPATTATASPVPRVNILIVDDEPRNLDALEAILGGDEYQLLRAEDADAALRLLLQNEEAAAIILDIQMPRVNGLELARLIKGTKKFRQIPILFLTARMGDDRDILSGYGAGAVDYLTKPFNPAILRHKVAVFADLFRKTRALAELNAKLDERVQERTAELERSEAALRAAAAQKDEFLAVLAHELRNPLAPLRTGLDLLLQVSSTEEPLVTHTLAVMNRQLAHIVRLIDDLLDVSRISRGLLELKKERTDLGELVRNSVETFRGLFEQKHITVSVAVAPQLYATVDRTRIAQIIGNLLHNASKFTPEKGTVSVELSYDNGGGQARVHVTDSGAGIPAEQIEAVFEMFTRIDRGGQSHGRAGTTPDRGAGIGLALARRLAGMHGGQLDVHSEGAGRGSTFTLTLVEIERAAQTAEIAAATRAASAPKRGLDVLVIEDNADGADLLAVWLQHAGHRVQVAATGPEGLEMTLSSKPDIVLCDVGLPDMDGVEVCRLVRERSNGHRPVMVALTGWGKDEDRQRTKEAGFDHHLVKPVELGVLSELLRNVSNS